MVNIRECLNRMIKKIMPEMWFEYLWIFYMNHNRKYSEDRYKYAYLKKGEMNKERYCILRSTAPGNGIMAVARYCLLACEWAEHHGMIPLVDFELEYYFKYDLIGKENMWDYVFEQGASVREIYQQQLVFVGQITKRYYVPSMSKKLFGSKKDDLIMFKSENWRDYYKQLNVYSSKWWVLRPEIKERFENQYAELFKPEMKIMGVALREEFSMEKEKIKNTSWIKHPHEPRLEEMIKLIKEYKEKWCCTHVFVSTMFEESIIALKKEFGDMLIYIERKRANFVENSKCIRVWEKYTPDEIYSWIEIEKKDDEIYNFCKKDRMIEYVEEMYGLSKCNCLLSSKNGGSLAACIWNGGMFDELKILDDDNKSIFY